MQTWIPDIYVDLVKKFHEIYWNVWKFIEWISEI